VLARRFLFVAPLGLTNCTFANIAPESASSGLASVARFDAHRMARRLVLFVENQDSWPVSAYEHEAVLEEGGRSGRVDGTGVVNHVHRGSACSPRAGGRSTCWRIRKDLAALHPWTAPSR